MEVLPGGADLTYPELSPPHDPVPEVCNPQLIPAVLQPTYAKVLDPTGQHEVDDVSIDLVAAVPNPTHAYGFLKHKKSIPLNRITNWGEIRFGVVYLHYPEDPPNTFRLPQESGDLPPFVAIKMLNKQVVDGYLAQGVRRLTYDGQTVGHYDRSR